MRRPTITQAHSPLASRVFVPLLALVGLEALACQTSSPTMSTSSAGQGGAIATTSSTGHGGAVASTTVASTTVASTTVASTAVTSSATSSGSQSATGTGGGGHPGSGCGKAGQPTGDLHLKTTDGKGTMRDYEVLVPASYSAQTPLALAVVYHGAGGDESAAKAFGLQNAPGAAASAIFVFPRGIPYQSYGIGWDDSCGGYDMVFFDHMLAALEADYCIDEARVFVAGFSWGCDQVTALTCCRGDRIRAVGAASCTDEYADASDPKSYLDLPCPVANGAAIRFTHDVNGDTGYPNPLFTTTSALYRSFNACSSTTTPVSPSPCKAFAGCDHPFVECAYSGLGHALPGSWAADTWSFFSSL